MEDEVSCKGRHHEDALEEGSAAEDEIPVDMEARAVQGNEEAEGRQGPSR